MRSGKDAIAFARSVLQVACHFISDTLEANLLSLSPVCGCARMKGAITISDCRLLRSVLVMLKVSSTGRGLRNVAWCTAVGRLASILYCLSEDQPTLLVPSRGQVCSPAVIPCRRELMAPRRHSRSSG